MKKRGLQITFRPQLLEKGYQHTVLNPHMTEGEHYERFWQANKASALVALQPSTELLEVRERMKEFRADISHKTSAPTANREDVTFNFNIIVKTQGRTS